MRKAGRKLTRGELVEGEATVLVLADVWKSTEAEDRVKGQPKRFVRHAYLLADSSYSNARAIEGLPLWNPTVLAIDEARMLLEGTEIERLGAQNIELEHTQVWSCRFITEQEWHESHARRLAERKRAHDKQPE